MNCVIKGEIGREMRDLGDCFLNIKHSCIQATLQVKRVIKSNKLQVEDKQEIRERQLRKK